MKIKHPKNINSTWKLKEGQSVFLEAKNESMIVVCSEGMLIPIIKRRKKR